VDFVKSKIFFISIFILLMAGYASISSVNAAGNSNISRAAILVDSSQLTDSNILNNYNCVRATFDYFGYKYDVLSYSTDLNTLANYQMIIALSPTTAGLVKNYTTSTNKWALILGRPASTLESAYHITYSSTINAASGSRTRTITTTNPMMAGKTIVYYSTYNDYVLGSGVTSGATTSDGHNLVLNYSGTNGSAVILNNGFDQQLVRNFISIADPSYVFVTGAYPYARDLGIIMRYDDLGDDPATRFVPWYNVSNDCTIAAVAHKTQPSDVAMVPRADLIPHSYDHVDLSALSDSDMQYQAQMSRSASTTLFGKPPIGFVAPWNYYNYNTIRILYQSGFRYMLVDSGLTTESNAKDLQYNSSGTDPNNQLWLMGYTTQDDDGGYVQQWWIDDSKESRGYYEVLLHTTDNATDDEATRQRIIEVVNKTTVHDSWFIEPSDDYFIHLDDAKKVTISGNTLQVNGSTVSGLVLWQPSGTSNVVLDNNTATIVSRNHMAMLPALTNGTHTFTYSSSYPKISTYTNGSLINSGYYDIQNKTMVFSIHDDDEIYTRTNVSLTGLNSTTLYLKKDGVALYSFTPTNGNYVLSNLVEGNYSINNTFSGQGPVANFSAYPTSGNLPLTVQFTDLSTNAATWNWNFGDGQTSTAQNPSHTYSSNGTYNVSLNVSNAAGYNISTKSNLISVTNGGQETNGPVVYYNGSVSGSSVLDLSGNSNNGVATGVTQGIDQDGRYYLNVGGSKKITVPKNAQTNISSPLSVEFYGTIDTFYQYGPIVYKYTDSTSGWYLCCSNAAPYNHAFFGGVVAKNSEKGFASNSALVAGQLSHIVITYDNNIAHIYINGVESGSAPWSAPLLLGNENIIIGGSYNGLNTQSNCSMYAFRLYNRALSASEVLQNYNEFNNSPSDSITMIKKLVYGNGGLPRYMGSYAIKQSGSGMSLMDSNLSSVGSVSVPYYKDNGGAKTDYTLSSSSISGVNWKTYFAPGSSATLSFSGNNRNRLENISLSNDSLGISNSVTYSTQSLVTLDAVPVTGNALQFFGDGLNTISGNTVQAYTDNGLIQNDCILNSTGGFVYNYYQKRPAGAIRSNSIEIPLSSPQLTPMPCPSGYLGSLSFAIHADTQDPDSLKTLMYGTNDSGNPVYGTKGYIGHGLVCTWGAFAESTFAGYGFDDASFKSVLDDMYAHGFEIVPHNVNGDWDEGSPSYATTAYYLPWYHDNYTSRNWIDHGLNHGNRNTGLKSLGLDKTSPYYIGRLLRQDGIQYAWAYQDITTEPNAGLSTSQTQSLGLPYDIVWTNTNFTWDDGTPMYEWTSTWAPDSTSLNYFKNDTVQTLINSYGVCFWHDYTAQNDSAFENYYYTKGNPDMINQSYDSLLQYLSDQKVAGRLWNPNVSQYIDYWRAACNVECKCTGRNTYSLINHNSATVNGYAMRATGLYTVNLDGNALSTKKNGADTVFWMNLSPGTHVLTLVGA
jgi:PKD repeat protein/peptidoglycan/xylan/chitin deacetylase (PgdA/CDA1 family)